MKALLFILILVPFLVIGCAQAPQVSPEPPTAPDASPEEVAPEASSTVEVARTLVIEPVGEGSYTVGSGYFMLSEDALESPGKANDQRYLGGSGGKPGEELIYIDDILKDTPAIHFEVNKVIWDICSIHSSRDRFQSIICKTEVHCFPGKGIEGGIFIQIETNK